MTSNKFSTFEIKGKKYYIIFIFITTLFLIGGFPVYDNEREILIKAECDNRELLERIDCYEKFNIPLNYLEDTDGYIKSMQNTNNIAYIFIYVVIVLSSICIVYVIRM